MKKVKRHLVDCMKGLVTYMADDFGAPLVR